MKTAIAQIVPPRLVNESAPMRFQELPQDVPLEDVLSVDTGTEWPLLPDAQYNCKLVKYEAVEMRMFRGALRLFAVFEILDVGEFFGKKLYGAWPVQRASKKEGGKTRLSVKAKSGLYMMLCRVLNYRVRPDRISLAQLKGHVLIVRTRTVYKDHRQRPYPEFMRYSVINEVLEVKET